MRAGNERGGDIARITAYTTLEVTTVDATGDWLNPANTITFGNDTHLSSPAGGVCEDELRLNFGSDPAWNDHWVGGGGIVYNPTTRAISGGTLSGFFGTEFNGSTHVPQFSVDGFTLDAVTFCNAMVGATPDDDLALVRSMFAGDDSFILSPGADNVWAWTGNDTLRGYAGTDTLYGQSGNDLLDGGAGLDRYRFSAALNATSNVDSLTGFTSGSDRRALDDAVFAGIGAAGALAAGAFRLGTAARDAGDRIAYDAASGALYFDADGNGAGAAIRFATLAPGTTLVAGDLVVI